MMRIWRWRILPPAYASTLAPLDSVTRNCVLGRISSTVPSISRSSSFAMGARSMGHPRSKRQPFEHPFSERHDRGALGNDLGTYKVISRLRLEFNLERRA